MTKSYSRSTSASPATSDSESDTDTEYSKRSSSEAPPQYSHLLAGFLNGLCGVCWSAAYVLYVLQARKDESAGMPLPALMLNITWEFVYTFVYKLNGIGRLIHFPWVFIDGLLVVETLRFGPKAWVATSPIIAEYFVQIFCIGTLLALSAQWTFANQFSRRNASFWSAYVCQNVLSWGSLWMLASAGQAGGHSMAIWWFRFIGSFAANLRYLYRVNVWPGKYGFLAGPFAMWILWMPCIADLLYPFAYKFIVHAAYDIAQK
ncbi:hypothetical protein D9619_000375 [Psilocybe cf. subviscida]|uniref:Uncharacterized protein n=1 Tax=Psilocybe cf. subviscida TaxID=2480587 RepID=A0A8H5F420_9AGAR|nr:hypothetical protein D9619_000375 [Psilocybe cf. subviscida]